MQLPLQNVTLPHYCCSCGEIGQVLCDSCKYDIIQDLGAQCFACLRPVGRSGDVCKVCATYYSRGWFVGTHRGALREIIARYKFKRMKSGADTLAQLLHRTLPQLPANVVVACVPTVAAHVRARGYDHAVLLAKHFAHLRGVSYHNPLRRNANTMQRGAARNVRLQQAKVAFTAVNAKAGTYLLLDDVSTTGATVNYAAKALLDAGAKEVWVATITREPLD